MTDWSDEVSADPIADIEAVLKQIEERGLEAHVHVLHPRCLTVDGWYHCTCGRVPVRNGQIDWEWGMEQIRAAR